MTVSIPIRITATILIITTLGLMKSPPAPDSQAAPGAIAFRPSRTASPPRRLPARNRV